MHLAKFDLKEYARLGAEARVAQLNEELSEIYRTFPDLRRQSARATSGRGPGRPAAADTSEPAGARRRRRRKPMSAAQRKAVSLRMKKYWAGRRKAQE
jgi:hypothetical protein